MIGWSQIVAELCASGLAGEALVAACRRIEAATTVGPSTGSGPEPSENPTVAATVGKKRFAADGELKPGADIASLAAKRDPMVARAALECVSGLSYKQRLVGEALFDHINAESGRCDPSIERLAGVAGCHRDTVFVAIRALEARGLILRFPYAGHAHANAYRVLWDNCAEIVSASENRRKQSGNPTRTQEENKNKHLSPVAAREEHPTVRHRARRQGHADPRQAALPLPISGSKALKAEAIQGREKAESSYFDRLVRQAKGLPAEQAVLSAVIGDNALLSRAMRAEKLREGEGLLTILRHLSDTGPPGRQASA